MFAETLSFLKKWQLAEEKLGVFIRLDKILQVIDKLKKDRAWLQIEIYFQRISFSVNKKSFPE